MAQPTVEQILTRAGELTPPPAEFSANDLEVKVEFYESEEITYNYEVSYVKERVANTPGWKPIEIKKI